MHSRSRSLAPLLLLPAALAASSCTSPLSADYDNTLRRSIIESAQRELDIPRRTARPTVLHRESRVDQLEIRPQIIEQLEEISGPSSYTDDPFVAGQQILGMEQPVASVTLQQAVAAALRHNLEIEFARLAPAVGEAQVVAAQAAFDWTFFSNFQWNNTDEPRAATRVAGQIVGSQADQRQVVDWNFGVRRRLITGGEFVVQHGLRYTDVSSPGIDTFPNPAQEPSIVLQLDQPILRGFGSDVTLAQVRLNRNAERDEIQALKSELIRVVTEVELAYWELVRARHDLLILERLLERGEHIREILRGRPAFRVPAQYADVVAQVESRRSNVLRARRAVSQASDQLKRLMNDPELTIGSNILVVPVDFGVDEPIEINVADAVSVAMASRPEVQRALLSIDNTSVRRLLAENATLPRLDARFQARFSGMGGSAGEGYSNLTEGDFVSMLIGLSFEQPIGNREAQSELRVRVLQQQQSIIAYRNTIQGIVNEVFSALRDLATNYILIEQTRAARLAAAENLRTIQIQRELLRDLTAEFLDLELRRQQALAAAEQDEIASLLDYNTAIARLHAATGTILERNRINFAVPDADSLIDRDPGDLFLPPRLGRGDGTRTAPSAQADIAGQNTSAEQSKGPLAPTGG